MMRLDTPSNIFHHLSSAAVPDDLLDNCDSFRRDSIGKINSVHDTLVFFKYSCDPCCNLYVVSEDKFADEGPGNDISDAENTSKDTSEDSSL